MLVDVGGSVCTGRDDYEVLKHVVSEFSSKWFGRMEWCEWTNGVLTGGSQCHIGAWLGETVQRYAQAVWYACAW